MRENPKVCLQADEIGSRSSWTSVVANGTYKELREPQYTLEKEYARERLAEYSEWWVTPLAEGRQRTGGDLSIEPVFFRIDIASMSGLPRHPGSWMRTKVTLRPVIEFSCWLSDHSTPLNWRKIASLRVEESR